MNFPSPNSKLRARGFSLVEMMVALTIGLGLLTVLALIFSQSSRAQKEVTQASQQVENGRYALELLTENLHHAGYYGYYYSLAAAPTSLVDPCSMAAADLRNGLAFPIQGYNSPSTSPLSCIDDANYVPGTDIVVVRRAATVTTASGSLKANMFYIQGTASPNVAANPIVAVGSGTFSLTARNGSGANVAAPIRQLQTHIYFVAPCSNPTGSGGTVCTATDDGGKPIPTLKRIELTVDSSNATALVTYPLVEGIENFQIEYGVDSDADGAPNSSFVTAPATVADWQNVMSATVYILARNPESTAGYTDGKTYAMGATSVTPGGAYKRHLYTSAVRIKNQSERRERP
jgi:type IV pilus assembly protein PilW